MIRTFCRSTAIAACVALVVLGLASTSMGAIVQTLTGGWTLSDISATDLADSSSDTFDNITIGGYYATNGASLDAMELVDGGYDAFINEASASADGAYTVTITFDTSTNTLGYDITAIDTYAGVSGHWGTKLQTHDIYMSLVGDESFDLLYSLDVEVADIVTDGYPLKVTLTEDSAAFLASGVDAIRFAVSETHDPANLDAFYHEFDVSGSPTVPEPATMGLLAAGAMLSALQRRKR